MCMIVKIDKLSHDLRGITRIDNKVTFIPKVLPDEVVNIRLTKQKRKINEASLVEVIDKSKDRVKYICPYYDICGGCDTGHILYSKSIMYKKDMVVDIFKRYCDMDVDMDVIYDEDNIYNYRNKITLRVNDGKLALVGENLVNIDYCYLVNDNINRVIGILNGICLDGIDEVIIRGTDEIMVIINGDVDNDKLIQILKDNVSSIFINDIKVFGNDYVMINVGNYRYAVYPNSFFQVNTKMISRLYDKVLEFAGKGNKLLDLYCGAGTIGIYLANNFNSIRGVEQNESAIKGANLNKDINGINNISFVCERASAISEIEEDVVVVDPPRSGLDSITIRRIMNSRIERLVYVSCNPITLARDINILKDKYNLVSMSLFDMFPNTSHAECVCLLNRQQGKQEDVYEKIFEMDYALFMCIYIYNIYL